MTPNDFIAKYAAAAQFTQAMYGVPASITLAQAALESAWGDSNLAVKANNFFGIKDQANDEWKGANVAANATEVINGMITIVPSFFRQYNSATESFNDHAKFLRANSRYKNLFSLNVTDFTTWAQGLQNARYATDPNYAVKLISLINNYNLNQYTVAAQKKKVIAFVAICTLLFAMIAGLIWMYFKDEK